MAKEQNGTEIPVKWFPWFKIEKGEDGEKWYIFGITIRW